MVYSNSFAAAHGGHSQFPSYDSPEFSAERSFRRQAVDQQRQIDRELAQELYDGLAENGYTFSVSLHPYGGGFALGLNVVNAIEDQASEESFSAHDFLAQLDAYNETVIDHAQIDRVIGHMATIAGLPSLPAYPLHLPSTQG